MPVQTWYFVRHGQTEWNAVARVQGRLDSRLTPAGRQHARDAARLLEALGVDALIASPLGRVRETVDIIRETLTLPVVFDDRLQEWSAGDWSGEFYAEIGCKWPTEWAAWEADRYRCRPPGGENFGDLDGRAHAFFAEAARLDAARVAVIGHGFMNRALAAALLGLSPAAALRIHQTNDTLIRISSAGDALTADHFIAGCGPLPGVPHYPYRPSNQGHAGAPSP